MEQVDEDEPSHINRFRVNKALHMIVDLNKTNRKRKLQAPHHLPSSKHRSSSSCSRTSDDHGLLFQLGNGEILDQDAETTRINVYQSAKDSFSRDSADSAMSTNESKDEMEEGKPCESSDFLVHASSHKPTDLPFVAFETHFGYICTQLATIDKGELEEVGMEDINAAIDQSDIQQLNTMEPTIDQEFQHYFSNLML